MKLGELQVALRTRDWAILTATHDGEPEITSNVANGFLRTQLDNFDVIELRGSYKGIPQGKSFLVFGIPSVIAIALGRQFGQESVLLPHGLVFCADESYCPIGEIIFGESAKSSECWSEIIDGPAFSFVIDWNTRIRAAA